MNPIKSWHTSAANIAALIFLLTTGRPAYSADPSDAPQRAALEILGIKPGDTSSTADKVITNNFELVKKTSRQAYPPLTPQYIVGLQYHSKQKPTTGVAFQPPNIFELAVTGEPESRVFGVHHLTTTVRPESSPKEVDANQLPLLSTIEEALVKIHGNPAYRTTRKPLWYPSTDSRQSVTLYWQEDAKYAPTSLPLCTQKDWGRSALSYLRSEKVENIDRIRNCGKVLEINISTIDGLHVLGIESFLLDMPAFADAVAALRQKYETPRSPGSNATDQNNRANLAGSDNKPSTASVSREQSAGSSGNISPSNLAESTELARQFAPYRSSYGERGRQAFTVLDKLLTQCTPITSEELDALISFWFKFNEEPVSKGVGTQYKQALLNAVNAVANCSRTEFSKDELAQIRNALEPASQSFPEDQRCPKSAELTISMDLPNNPINIIGQTIYQFARNANVASQVYEEIKNLYCKPVGKPEQNPAFFRIHYERCNLLALAGYGCAGLKTINLKPFYAAWWPANKANSEQRTALKPALNIDIRTASGGISVPALDTLDDLKRFINESLGSKLSVCGGGIFTRSNFRENGMFSDAIRAIIEVPKNSVDVFVQNSFTHADRLNGYRLRAEVQIESKTYRFFNGKSWSIYKTSYQDVFPSLSLVLHGTTWKESESSSMKLQYFDNPGACDKIPK